RVLTRDAGTGKGAGVTPARWVCDAFSLSKDGQRIAILREAPATPPEVYVGTLSERSVRRLTWTNPQLDEVNLGEAEPVRWKSKELEVEGVLVRPVGYKQGRKYPLLTFLHGGPALQFRLAFTPYGTTPQAQRYPVHVFAGRGYLVFCPNVRGSAGYGE